MDIIHWAKIPEGRDTVIVVGPKNKPSLESWDLIGTNMDPKKTEETAHAAIPIDADILVAENGWLKNENSNFNLLSKIKKKPKNKTD